MPVIHKVSNLAELPPHVFFDGTPPDDRVYQKVYGGATVERFPSTLRRIVPQPGSLKVIHTDTNDLYRTGIWQRGDDLKRYLKSVVRRERERQQAEQPLRLFVAGTKNHVRAVREALATEWDGPPVVEEGAIPPEEGDYLLLGYFGGLRGLNHAERCNVGVMLGTFLVQGAVSIARAMPSLLGLLPEAGCSVRDLIRRGSQPGEPNAELVEAIRVVAREEEQYRRYEQMQVMTRTRHLNHPVRFYVVSRDLIQEYPFISPDDYAVDLEGREIFPEPRNARAIEQTYEVAFHAYLIEHPDGIRWRELWMWLQQRMETDELADLGERQVKRYFARFRNAHLIKRNGRWMFTH